MVDGERKRAWEAWKAKTWPSGMVPEGAAYHCGSAFGAGWDARATQDADVLALAREYLDAVDHYGTDTMVIGTGERERAYERMELARRALAKAIDWESSIAD